MPKVGLNMATTGEDDAKMKPGAVAGVEAEYRASNLIGVSAGVLYSMQGAKWSEGDYTSKVSILRNTHCMPYGLIVILPPHNNQTE